MLHDRRKGRQDMDNVDTLQHTATVIGYNTLHQLQQLNNAKAAHCSTLQQQNKATHCTLQQLHTFLISLRKGESATAASEKRSPETGGGREREKETERARTRDIERPLVFSF